MAGRISDDRGVALATTRAELLAMWDEFQR